jgi:hypothetical protein
MGRARLTELLSRPRGPRGGRKPGRVRKKMRANPAGLQSRNHGHDMVEEARDAAGEVVALRGEIEGKGILSTPASQAYS